MFEFSQIAFGLRRNFQTSLALQKLVTFNLSDIGEGIHEVSVKEWFVAKFRLSSNNLP